MAASPANIWTATPWKTLSQNYPAKPLLNFCPTKTEKKILYLRYPVWGLFVTAINNYQATPGLGRKEEIRGRRVSLELAAAFVKPHCRIPIPYIHPQAGFFFVILQSTGHWPPQWTLSFTQAIPSLDGFLQYPLSSCLWQYTHSFSLFGSFIKFLKNTLPC